jgi:hypothetical protein
VAAKVSKDFFRDNAVAGMYKVTASDESVIDTKKYWLVTVLGEASFKQFSDLY